MTITFSEQFDVGAGRREGRDAADRFDVADFNDGAYRSFLTLLGVVRSTSSMIGET